MGFAVQFDCQPGLCAEKIDDVRAKPDLLPELQPRNLSIAEMFPKPLCLVAVSSPHPPKLRLGPSLSPKAEGHYTSAISGASSAFMPIT